MKKTSTFEKVLDITEENKQLRDSLRDVLMIMDAYGNIEVLLSLKEKLKLSKARDIAAPQHLESKAFQGDNGAMIGKSY